MTSLKVLILSVLISFSSLSSAAIISTDLASDTYITSNGLDWTWASPVASTNHSRNELKAPSFHSGWRYATDKELSILATIKDLFFTIAGSPIHSAQYWNTVYTHVDTSDWNANRVRSVPNGTIWETVYVRDLNVSEVPVPAAAFLFAPALLGFLGLRRKATNSNV